MLEDLIASSFFSRGFIYLFQIQQLSSLLSKFPLVRCLKFLHVMTFFYCASTFIDGIASALGEVCKLS